MATEEELMGFIREQMKVEREIVESINKGLKNVTNPAVKGTLKAISLDSIKHSEMYDSAAKLLTMTPQALTQENLDEQRALIEKHIRIEARLMKKIAEILPKLKNDKVNLLLGAILEDEKRHHELLNEILKILVKGETITNDEWWDVIWQNVPTHGSPGG